MQTCVNSVGLEGVDSRNFLSGLNKLLYSVTLGSYEIGIFSIF
jgi:hypothetical protein